MMRWTRCIAGILLAVATTNAASAADPDGVWLKDATDADGGPRLDIRNPDPARRSRPVCGLVVMGGLKPAGPERWDGGSVNNPQDGRIYSGDMTLLTG